MVGVAVEVVAAELTTERGKTLAGQMMGHLHHRRDLQVDMIEVLRPAERDGAAQQWRSRQSRNDPLCLPPAAGVQNVEYSDGCLVKSRLAAGSED